jgi:hypothetical protein
MVRRFTLTERGLSYLLELNGFGRTSLNQVSIQTAGHAFLFAEN